MDYENKHQEEIIRATQLWECGDITRENLEYIFPELQESEDEKIRKDLIKWINEFPDTIWRSHNKKDVIAWLEKQGEQKPADKVEPKFNTGEWLCENEPNNYARFIQILEVVNVQGKERYKISRDLHNDEDVVECRFIENNYHSFTIQDAKDGDVLAFDNDHIILVKESHNSTWGWRLSCWCHLLDGEFEVVEYHTKTEGLHPTTKEQRDHLFAKIREACYVWDADKKKLRKIEEKPKWSEEDEELLQHCCGAVAAADYYTLEDKEEMENWLKSLKQRIEQ